MNPESACKLLGISDRTEPAELRQTYERQKAQLEEKLQRAPTPSLQAKYRQRLIEAKDAFVFLSNARTDPGPAPVAENLPRLSEIADAGESPATSPPSAPVGSPLPAASAMIKQKPATDANRRWKRATIGVSAVTALLGVVILWLVRDRDSGPRSRQAAETALHDAPAAQTRQQATPADAQQDEQKRQAEVQAQEQEQRRAEETRNQQALAVAKAREDADRAAAARKAAQEQERRVAIENARAPITRYTDRPAFNSVTTNRSVIDFEGIAPRGEAIRYKTQKGVTIKGVRFVGTDARGIVGSELYIESSKVRDWGTGDNLVGDRFGFFQLKGKPVGNIEAILPPDTYAFGTDYMLQFASGERPAARVLFDVVSGGKEFSFEANSKANGIAFVGFVSSQPILSVKFRTAGVSGDHSPVGALDNFTVASVVPQ